MFYKGGPRMLSKMWILMLPARVVRVVLVNAEDLLEKLDEHDRGMKP
jgi:hypothetical protein